MALESLSDQIVDFFGEIRNRRNPFFRGCMTFNYCRFSDTILSLQSSIFVFFPSIFQFTIVWTNENDVRGLSFPWLVTKPPSVALQKPQPIFNYLDFQWWKLIIIISSSPPRISMHSIKIWAGKNGKRGDRTSGKLSEIQFGESRETAHYSEIIFLVLWYCRVYSYLNFRVKKIQACK